ncbi:hypothetical protein [Mesorhizobium sp.]|uniref:hypothetical protein n=1 Tax=Mesorhizobium sp. TaxID=1871066 RepID=UPI000FE8D4BC|nr:hypothetical protein [Mesorhizobium sp.]RWI96081.1 MAG: hypothetical protein EOR21_08620 [Mesorhizobium sp.]
MPVPELLLQRRKEMLQLKLSKRPFRQVRRTRPAILLATSKRAIGLWPKLQPPVAMDPEISWGTYRAQSAALWTGLRMPLPRRIAARLTRYRKTRRTPPARPGKRRLHSHNRPGLHKKRKC